MTENKRFRIEYVQGNPTIFHIVENGEHIDEIKIVDLLNALHEENQALKKQLQSEHQMLENAILLERTRMGQNALKQYKEAIQ